MTPHSALRFEAFTIDLERLCLEGPAGRQNLRPKSFDVLRYIAERAGRVVTKEEVLGAVWPGVTVTDESLTQCISEIRRAIGDQNQRIIKTIPRRGYMVDVPIAASNVPSVQASDALEASATVELLPSNPPLPSRPSIAVLPFTNLSGDPGQEYFADGIVEDITTELSRFAGLFVVARNSSFQYKGESSDVRRVGRELGVRYVLEGSVRRIGDRIRVAAQLIDAESGGHLWAEKYDHDDADILALQDGITESLVAAIEPEILVGEGRRAARKSPVNLGAFDCCMRGMWHSNRHGAQEYRHAETWLRRSIELDPMLARAHAMLARVLAVRCWAGYSDNIERDLQASQAAVERALSLDDRDSAAHFALSILSVMTRRHERALAAARRAIELNPNFALGYFALGEARIFMGLFSKAIDPMMRCLRLTPRDPWASFFVSLIALAHYHLGNYADAVHYAERALQTRRTWLVLRTLAATLAQLGRTEEARARLAEMEQVMPIYVERHWELTLPYANPAHKAHLLEGLRKAGWVGAQRRTIGSDPRYGHSMDETLSADNVLPRDDSKAAAFVGAAPRIPDKPSIAVLPFTNMSGDSQQEYFSDGITEDIITALSRLRWFFVIARNSTFVYKGQGADVKQVGRDLGVRYVLEGSVRKSGERVRITAQLVDAVTARHIWAERYERGLIDIFELQEEIAASVAAAIEPKLLAAEGMRSATRSIDDLDAWDLVARALSHFWKLTAAGSDKAIAILRQAVDRHPDYAPAHSMMAFALVGSAHVGWTPPGSDRVLATKLAERALELDDSDPWAHMALGYLAIVDRQTDEAVRHFRTALNLNPNFATAQGYMGFALLLDGQSEDALHRFEQAMRMSPRDPLNAWILAAVSAAHYLRGRYLEAVNWARQAVQLRPGILGGHRILCASLAQAGQIAEAQASMRTLRQLQPDISINVIKQSIPYAAEPMEHFLDGLRKAGLSGR